MSLIASDPGGDFTPIPEGTHVARCYYLADLGLRPNPFDDGMKEQVVIGFEVPGERTEDDHPMVVSQIYTKSLHEKANLRKSLESWRGKKFTAEELAGFDLRNIVGKPCQVSMAHKDAKDGKVYAKVAGVMALPKGMEAPPAENEALVYDKDAHDPEIFEKLPEWVRRMIRGEDEPAKEEEKEEPDDLPF